MDINEQYELTLHGDKTEREKLFDALAVRFRLFLYQRIRDESDAEDIAQDALMTVARLIDEITIETSFAAWAYKILDNKILSYIKKNRNRRVELTLESAGDSVATAVSSDPDLKAQLMDCLRQLCRENARYARTLNLHYQGYTTDEVCDRMKISRTNSYAILSRARVLLKRCLEKGTLR